MTLWCSYFEIFLFFCVFPLSQQQKILSQGQDADLRFQLLYQWSYLNFTWESTEQYRQASESGDYIPSNIVPTGMKMFKNLMFLTLPKFKTGVPATLVYFDMKMWPESGSSLLTPYPNWPANNNTNCSNLQSVQSMEIDTKGIMWVIDGVRINNNTHFPAKLVLLDLNNGGNIIHTYNFPEDITMPLGGFLNDIVIDESDGVFAYITDNSKVDPGVIVYSRSRDHSWKLRDVSMFAEVGDSFIVEDYVFNRSAPVDGIALSPKSNNSDRRLFYCALSGVNLYSIPTSTIKNETLLKTKEWKAKIRNDGEKMSQSDGLIIDNESNMYQTMLPLYGVAKWNIHEPIATSKVIDKDIQTMIWPDGFAFDQNGYLYLISNKVYQYGGQEKNTTINADIQFRILRLFTGTNSYLY